MSITTAIKSFFTPFDEDAYIAKLREENTHYLIANLNLSNTEIKRVWKEYNLYTRSVGKNFHSFIEKYFERTSSVGTIKIDVPSYNRTIKGIEHYIPVDKKDFSKEIEQFIFFTNLLTKKGYVVFAIEKKIKDPNTNLTGIIDAIFYNNAKHKYLIVDWKVCKDNFEELMDPLWRGKRISLYNLPDNKFGLYSLQLLSYKKMFGRKEKVSLKLVQFHDTFDCYKAFKVKND